MKKGLVLKMSVMQNLKLNEVVPSIQEQEASLDFDLADFYEKFELKQHTTEEIEEDKIKHKVFPTKTSYSSLEKN